MENYFYLWLSMGYSAPPVCQYMDPNEPKDVKLIWNEWVFLNLLYGLSLLKISLIEFSLNFIST